VAPTTKSNEPRGRNMRRASTRSLLAALLALMMVLAACGNGDDGETAVDAEEDEPLAFDLEEEETEEEAEAEPEEAPVEEVDVVAEVDAFASTIPEGFLFIRELDEFKDALAVENVVLIDVREAGEYAEGHIPGAVNIPIRELAQSTELIPTDRPVWVYCLSGWRAGMATAALGLMGYDNVTAYSPGSVGWEAAGEELVVEDSEPESFGDPGLQAAMVDAVDDFLATIPEGFYANNLEATIEARDAGVVLVDVREPEEYEDGFIEDALSVPIRSIVSTDVEVPQDQPVIVYCGSAFRAGMAQTIYRLIGYTNVEGYAGRFAAMVEAGYTTDSA
jgi:rhodanese-related sulfurtransferase